MNGLCHLREISSLAQRLAGREIDVIGHQFDHFDFGYWSLEVHYKNRGLRVISPGWRDGAYLTICHAEDVLDSQVRWKAGVSVTTPEGESAFTHAEREIIARFDHPEK